jgi:hypothetical protein
MARKSRNRAVRKAKLPAPRVIPQEIVDQIMSHASLSDLAKWRRTSSSTKRFVDSFKPWQELMKSFSPLLLKLIHQFCSTSSLKLLSVAELVEVKPKDPCTIVILNRWLKLQQTISKNTRLGFMAWAVDQMLGPAGQDMVCLKEYYRRSGKDEWYGTGEARVAEKMSLSRQICVDKDNAIFHEQEALMMELEEQRELAREKRLALGN